MGCFARAVANATTRRSSASGLTPLLHSQVDWSRLRRPALECQAPWSAALLEGAKRVETRTYALPAGLLGRELLLLESPRGGSASAVGDFVSGGRIGGAAGLDGSGGSVVNDGPSTFSRASGGGGPRLRLAGEVTFDACFAYESEEAWAADFERHRVPGSDAHYSWQAVERRGALPIYGWVVGRRRGWDESEAAAFVAERVPRCALRVHRSLFAVRCAKEVGAIPELDVPTVDITPFLEDACGSQADRAAAAAAALEQCRGVGFLRVSWRGLEGAGEPRALHAALRDFFSLPEAAKIRASKAGVEKSTDSYISSGYRGVSGRGYNRYRQSWSWYDQCFPCELV